MNRQFSLRDGRCCCSVGKCDGQAWWTPKTRQPKRVWERGIFFCQLSLIVCALQSSCLCIFIRCHVRAEPKNERTKKKKEKKTGRLSMVTIRPSTVWCADASQMERENEKAPGKSIFFFSLPGRPNYQHFFLSFLRWVDFFRLDVYHGPLTRQWTAKLDARALLLLSAPLIDLLREEKRKGSRRKSICPETFQKSNESKKTGIAIYSARFKYYKNPTP